MMLRKIDEENEENTYAEGDNEDADKTMIMMRKIMRMKIMRKRMKRVMVKRKMMPSPSAPRRIRTLPPATS